MLRVGIVGLGLWGQRLVSSCDNSSLLRFTAAVTRTPAKAAEFAGARNLPLGSDYAALLADPAIDAVALATPHSQHAEQMIAAAAAGKHIFVEKPFTLDVPGAEAAVAAARQAGVVLALGHNRRFLPALRELKRLIEAGTLGEILHAAGTITAPAGYRYRPGGWRAEAAESPAGGMTGLGIHVVDALISLAGGIAEVTAHSFRRVVAIDLDDTTAMLFRFQSGASGGLVTLTATAPTWRLQIFGSKGWAEMRGETVLEVALIDGKPVVTEHPTLDKERAELEAFARAVAGEQPYPIPPAEAIHGVAVLDAIIRSAKSGETVRIAAL
jgi:predicted dehydrogenase